MFHTGQKVVHVGFPTETFWERLRAWWWPQPPECPEVGEVYTIVNIISGPWDHPCLELLELPSPATEHWEAGFSSEGFRPVVKRKTSISVFTQMLTPTPEPVE